MKQGRGNSARRPIASGLLLAVLMGTGSFAGRLNAVEDEKLTPSEIAPELSRNDHSLDISRWFSNLSDEQPAIREGARQNLLTLRRKDLSALRTVVKSHLPLLPTEEAILRDVVTHV